MMPWPAPALAIACVAIETPAIQEQAGAASGGVDTALALAAFVRGGFSSSSSTSTSSSSGILHLVRFLNQEETRAINQRHSPPLPTTNSLRLAWSSPFLSADETYGPELSELATFPVLGLISCNDGCIAETSADACDSKPMPRSNVGQLQSVTPPESPAVPLALDAAVSACTGVFLSSQAHRQQQQQLQDQQQQQQQEQQQQQQQQQQLQQQQQQHVPLMAPPHGIPTPESSHSQQLQQHNQTAPRSQPPQVSNHQIFLALTRLVRSILFPDQDQSPSPFSTNSSNEEPEAMRKARLFVEEQARLRQATRDHELLGARLVRSTQRFLAEMRRNTDFDVASAERRGQMADGAVKWICSRQVHSQHRVPPVQQE